ncbi:MAG TPA: ABC transporter permease [Vicinamibacterales bacterium]|nr:ABC transporter permease [Vicinamibacterales bacterium]
MSAVSPDTGAALPATVRWLPRPGWPASLLLDGSIATGAYLAATWIRFQDVLTTFLPAAWSVLPFVVSAQIAGVAAAGAYSRQPGAAWLLRILLGAVLGTALASALVGFFVGFEGVSRGAFVADGLFLVIGVVGWRGMWLLRVRASSEATDQLVDRASEMASLGATIIGFYRYRELLKNLVLKDLKLKYRGSVFGFLWSLANPLLMILVYSLAFGFILRVRTEAFVFYLMLGQLAWTFFASSTAMSSGAIVDNAGLIRSVHFPRIILPVGTVLFNLAQYLLTFSVFLPVMLVWYSVPPSAPMLLFPVLLALQVAFTIGVGLIVATATTFFRDVRHLIEVALGVLFWTTPIVYELAQVPERLRLMILLSPVSPFVVGYHSLFFYRTWPDPDVWVVAATYAIGALVVGTAFFLAFEDRFMEQV